jgi:hypothetical protein
LTNELVGFVIFTCAKILKSHIHFKVKVSNKPFIYIASQAPTQSTLSDFLQMIWEQNVKIVVMLYNKKVSPNMILYQIQTNFTVIRPIIVGFRFLTDLSKI